MGKINDSVVSYLWNNDYIIHNHTNNSWIVVSRNQYEYAKRYLTSGDKPTSDTERKISNLIKLYKINDLFDSNKTMRNFEERYTHNEDHIPETVYLVTTYKCNLKCIYCYAECSPARENDGELTDEELLLVIGDLKNIGVKNIVLRVERLF
jgi:2-iminoacetate synthase ThiH